MASRANLHARHLSNLLSFICESRKLRLDGAKLYRSNCSSLYAIEDHLTGPRAGALVIELQRDGWIASGLRNSQKVIQSGDAYAVIT